MARQPGDEFAWNAHLPNGLRSVGLLHAADVEILAGTDAAHLGAPGLAHGASLHGGVLPNVTPAAR